MKDDKIVTQGLVNAALSFGYIAVIGTLLYNGKWIFGEADTVMAPIIMLLLLVISAAVMAMLVFGKPLMLYIDGKRREGVLLAGYTVGALAAIAVLFLTVMAVINQGMY